MQIIPDISHHNKNNYVFNNISDFDAIAVKLTEGCKYVDSEIPQYRKFPSKNKEKLLIGYHYCRLDMAITNEEIRILALKECNHLVDRLKSFTQKKDNLHVVGALDFEEECLKKSCIEQTIYLTTFITEYYELCGVAPLLYVNQFQVENNVAIEKVKKTFPDLPLWVARYKKNVDNPGIIKPWGKFIMWQFTSTPFCLNFADIESLKRYEIID